MRLIASYVLHYGMEWLYWSIKSVANYVDQIHIFYTPWPSHGHGTDLVCPETAEDILTSLSKLYNVSGHITDKIVWHDCQQRFAHEGEHRTYAVNMCGKYGATHVLVVDADEIWPGEVIQKLLDSDLDRVRSYRIGMRHFWRSLKYVCDDGAMPTRVINLMMDGDSEGYLYEPGRVLHMGYAQSPEIIRYKQDIHGHKAEWRQGWYENYFLPWRFGLTNVHPTSENYWDPDVYDDIPLLQELVGDHPYMGKEIITDDDKRYLRQYFGLS